MDCFSCCGNRKEEEAAAPASASKSLAGVGIVFQPDESGQLFVKALAVGGPAELSGKVQVGDCLKEVGGENVVGKSINAVAHMILGQPGTSVRIGITRGTPEVIYVDLTRGWSLSSSQATPNRWSHPLPTNSRLVTANVAE
eukprot:CAMPEP_0175859964 /NCGR_PEP_ID=MMETSP0107_2-20121207/30555_1 /TAXON_ID=195067 ORGANISM="Goniomonas pacifica, Strain CCMP1869" /NCGR_SAMPLE_ID=MMETSP0107_2 /ASSEMBLY_ACC=CAM_ASM_000203 /LENGTH=140 /DNA_ID=CAMNT_0017176657 /DNA_START=15 /DNA_END=437 /DNA_ORIENTATION=-